MKRIKTILVFLSILSLTCVLLCACSQQKESKASLEAEETTVSQTTTEMTTVVETTTEIITEEPTTEEMNNDTWKQVYINYINNLDYAGNYEYALVYVNEDDIPELYMHGTQRPMSSELCWIYDDEVYSQQLMIDGFEYHEKNNLFFSSGVQAGVQGDFVYKINGSKATEISKGTASRLIQGQERFIWNGEDVSENEYNSLRAEAFDSSKAKSVDVYKTKEELTTTIENL